MVGKREITEKKINKIIELSINNKDISRKKIAKSVGVSYDTVWRYQKKYLKGILL